MGALQRRKRLGSSVDVINDNVDEHHAAIILAGAAETPPFP